MCGYAFDPDFLLTWPNAITGVMGGEQAAITMAQVARASAKRKGIDVDEERVWRSNQPSAWPTTSTGSRTRSIPLAA